MSDSSRISDSNPDLITRRDVCMRGGLGVVALGLGRGFPSSAAVGSGDTPGALILLTMVGGASPWETFDPKPDAPDRLRGPFGSIASAVPGVRLSEHLPEVARRMRMLTIIRSIHHDADPTHEAGLRLLATGRADQGHPALGSRVAQALGSRGGMPPFVVLPRPVGRIEGLSRATRSDAGSASPFDPFIVGESASSVGFDPVGVFNRARRWVADSSARGLKVDTMSPIPFERGCDRDQTRRGVRGAYGASEFGLDCRLAARMVQAGSRVVVVNMARTVFGQPSWDGHGRKPFGSFDDLETNLLPAFDQGFSGLVDDLQARRLLDSTLVVAVGEFGRTPWINESGGRDHWPGAWSALLAGGGTLGGQVIGATDLGGRPSERPVPVADLVATMAFASGIDLALDWVRLGESRPSPVSEIFG